MRLRHKPQGTHISLKVTGTLLTRLLHLDSLLHCGMDSRTLLTKLLTGLDLVLTGGVLLSASAIVHVQYLILSEMVCQELMIIIANSLVVSIAHPRAALKF